MKAINFKLEENFHREIKVFCATKGITVMDFFAQAAKEKLEKES